MQDTISVSWSVNVGGYCQLSCVVLDGIELRNSSKNVNNDDKQSTSKYVNTYECEITNIHQNILKLKSLNMSSNQICVTQ